MLRRTRAIFLTLVTASLNAGAADPVALEPGLWHVETRTKTGDGPIFTSERELCLTQERLRDLPCYYAPRSPYGGHCSCTLAKPLEHARNVHSAGVRCSHTIDYDRRSKRTTSSASGGATLTLVDPRLIRIEATLEHRRHALANGRIYDQNTTQVLGEAKWVGPCPQGR